MGAAQTPRHHWQVGADDPATIQDVRGKAHASIAPAGATAIETVGGVPALVLDGKRVAAVTDDHATLGLPDRSLTVAAWVRVDAPQAWGGIVSVVQDNGSAETGWLLGFRGSRFAFGLATKGADDGDGLITYLSARTAFTAGRWHHVCGTYDGKVQRIYVDGERLGESVVQNGPILYPKKTFVELGAYHDRDEHFPIKGRLHEAKIWKQALSAGRVRREWARLQGKMPPPQRISVPGITSAELDPAIEKGVRWLLSMQHADGSWAGLERDYYVGQSALCVYTLLKCGLAKDHPAIRAGIQYLRSKDYRRTYDLGIVLMAFGELHDPDGAEELLDLAKRLQRLCGNGSPRRQARWGYPFGFSDGIENGNTGYEDISNTQYALLGLRAARKAGARVGNREFWQRVAKALVDDQSAYGGFGYRHGATTHTSSLTAAGVCSLIIVRDILDDVGASAGVRGKVRAAINNGLMWFKDHWSVTTNVNGAAAWYYYYMYGLERVGSYLSVDRIGGHDWHSEGARKIIGYQKKNGSWGDGDMDTCFALLFLRRGSRASGLGPRNRAEASIAKDAPLVVGARVEGRLLAYARRLGPPIAKALAGKTAALEWQVDGTRVARRDGIDAKTLFETAANLETTDVTNGRHVVRALLHVPGLEEPVASNAFEVWVDDVQEAWHREAARDHMAKNLLAGGTATASSAWAKSRWSSFGASMAIDGRYATSWWAKADDADPWLEVTARRRVTVSVIKLALNHSHGRLAAPTFERPHRIEVSIDGGKPFPVTLRDEPFRKQVIRVKKRRLRTVRIRIRSRFPGKRGVGLKEIELFEDLAPGDLKDALIVH